MIFDVLSHSIGEESCSEMIESEKIVNNICILIFPILKDLDISSVFKCIYFIFLQKLDENFSSYKSWQREFWDFFLQQEFFLQTSEEIIISHQIMKKILQYDDEKLFEFFGIIYCFLGKISFSSNLFISKENELLNKSLDCKRAGFIIFSCSNEDHRLKLHNIQEKIHEIIKCSSDNINKSDIFLFFRILLVKFNEESLLSLWPLISGELVTL